MSSRVEAYKLSTEPLGTLRLTQGLLTCILSSNRVPHLEHSNLLLRRSHSSLRRCMQFTGIDGNRMRAQEQNHDRRYITLFTR
jgi:hypothetical protein